MNAVQQQKRELRKEIQARVRALPPEERRQQSAAICAKLIHLPQLQSSRAILTFSGLPDEPNLEELWQHDRNLIFPRVHGEELELWRVSCPESLVPGTFGIREPNPERCQRVSPSQIELILVPGVAFDQRDGNRLGRGGGFYDRLLAETKAATIGICFAEQLVEFIPHESHDRAVDSVVSSTD